MMKKTLLYAMILGTTEALLCTDVDELRAQLAAKDVELELLDAAVQKQEARYTIASDKFVDLRERCINARKSAAQKNKSNKTDEQIRAEFLEEVSRFATTYYGCSSPEGYLKSKEFLVTSTNKDHSNIISLKPASNIPDCSTFWTNGKSVLKKDFLCWSN